MILTLYPVFDFELVLFFFWFSAATSLTAILPPPTLAMLLFLAAGVARRSIAHGPQLQALAFLALTFALGVGCMRCSGSSTPGAR